MGPYKGRVEGKENLPRPAGRTLLNGVQDPIGLLGNQGTLLAHGQLIVPGPSPQSYFLEDQPRACTGALGYSSLGAGPCTCFCWIPSRSSPHNSPACPGFAEWQHSLPVYDVQGQAIP